MNGTLLTVSTSSLEPLKEVFLGLADYGLPNRRMVAIEGNIFLIVLCYVT